MLLSVKDGDDDKEGLTKVALINDSALASLITLLSTNVWYNLCSLANSVLEKYFLTKWNYGWIMHNNIIQIKTV